MKRLAAAGLVGAVGAVVTIVAVVVVAPRAPSAPAAGRPALTPTAAPAAARFVGETVCASCHAREAAAWRGSHHQQAMQPASAATVLGDFAGARVSHDGVASRFFRQGGKLVARTDGPDGALHDYEITHTFGVAPLQQYLVAFPGGRFQALELAWDSRARGDGGQRWFHLYPHERIPAGDALHWTGAAENWNYMCADCHSTNVRKGWDDAHGSYATSFAEMSVSCEACHGPGSAHAADPRARLPIALDERAGVSWTRDAATGKPHRSRPLGSAREIEMCARCHSRRGLLHEDHVHGQPVGDDYRVALLDDELYYPDGQQKGEVYEYGSFVQSRMFAEGVTCSDCHDPHRPGVRASGDNLCLQCHAQATYVSPKHHFHTEGSAGSRCVGCHMPATAYMVVDPRRDHSFRVPRPDLSVKLGVPNACNGCHAERSAAWAARTVEKWYGHTPSGYQRFGEALAAAGRGAPDAQALLQAVADDRAEPAIARASAIERMARQLTPATLGTVRAALDDPDALVRRAAVHALADVEPALRGPLIAGMLDDAVRSVRIEAAEAMAGVAPGSLAPREEAALARATADFLASAALNADRPESHLALARHHAARQAWPEAEAELKRAVAIDPAFVPAVVNLADLYRQLDRDADGERLLRAALARTPAQPTLLHTLGLVLVRTRRLAEATELLGQAARLGPDNPRFGFVYAVALHDGGQRRQALRALADLLLRHPNDRDALAAREAYRHEPP